MNSDGKRSWEERQATMREAYKYQDKQDRIFVWVCAVPALILVTGLVANFVVYGFGFLFS